MTTYYGGQIRKQHRGNLAVIVTLDAAPNEYDPFLYEIGSDDYYHLTGAWTVDHPIVRAYIGINHESGERLVRAVREITPNKPDTEVNLRTLDRLVVISFFLSHPEVTNRV